MGLYDLRFLRHRYAEIVKKHPSKDCSLLLNKRCIVNFVLLSRARSQLELDVVYYWMAEKPSSTGKFVGSEKELWHYLKADIVNEIQS